MQEINYARQESSAQCSGRKEYRCRVCDGPVERPRLVCRQCSDRELENGKWERYLDSDDTTTRNKGPNTREGYCWRFFQDSSLLIVLCGPSHSGKSNFARKLRLFFKVVNSDKIRKRLTGSNAISDDESDIWERFESTKCKFLKQGYNVILDACHIFRKARWHSVQNVPSGYKKICIVFDLPFSAIRKRWLKEKRIPYSEVKRLWERFQKEKPSPDELMLLGFDEIYFVKECPVCTAQPAWQGHGAGQSITGRSCHATLRATRSHNHSPLSSG